MKELPEVLSLLERDRTIRSRYMDERATSAEIEVEVGWPDQAVDSEWEVGADRPLSVLV